MGHQTSTAADMNTRCSAMCIPWFVTEELYKAGMCHMEKMRLKEAKATTGWVATRASRKARSGRSRGRMSQSGVPRISSGGATSVSSTCWDHVGAEKIVIAQDVDRGHQGDEYDQDACGEGGHLPRVTAFGQSEALPQRSHTKEVGPLKDRKPYQNVRVAVPVGPNRPNSVIQCAPTPHHLAITIR